jgi:hypothetical protein
MSELAWQKSSFSGQSDQLNCVELATGHDRTILLRESDRPAEVLTIPRRSLAAFIDGIKTGTAKP